MRRWCQWAQMLQDPWLWKGEQHDGVCAGSRSKREDEKSCMEPSQQAFKAVQRDPTALGSASSSCSFVEEALLLKKHFYFFFDGFIHVDSVSWSCVPVTSPLFTYPAHLIPTFFITYEANLCPYAHGFGIFHHSTGSTSAATVPRKMTPSTETISC